MQTTNTPQEIAKQLTDVALVAKVAELEASAAALELSASSVPAGAGASAQAAAAASRATVSIFREELKARQQKKLMIYGGGALAVMALLYFVSKRQHP